MKSFVLAAFFCISCLASLAQTKAAEKAKAYADEKYQKRAEELRKQVWAWDKPALKTRDIPAEHARASKVVLARITELTAEHSHSIGLYEQNLSETIREVIKLNDKRAIDEYSELSFTKLERTSGYYSSYGSQKRTTFIGVHIIKPDGQVQEINADDMVVTKDEQAEKKAKIAIPGLQPGDILDYYMTTDRQIFNDFSADWYNLMLFEDAPVLYLSFHAQLEKKFSVDHKSYNGAPALKISKNADDEIIIDLEKKNIPFFETALWVAPLRQMPFIRISIGMGYSGIGSKRMDINKPGEIKTTSSAEVLEDYRTSITTNFFYNYQSTPRVEYQALILRAKDYAKKAGQSFNDMTDEQKAAQLFYTLRYDNLLAFDAANMAAQINIGQKKFDGLTIPLACMYRMAELQPSILISESNNAVRMNDAMSVGDIFSIAYLPAMKKCVHLGSVYDIPFVMPDEAEGANTKNLSFGTFGGVMTEARVKGLDNMNNGPNLTPSTADKNAHVEKLSISLNGDKSLLAVNRKTVLKGQFKKDVQKDLLLYEDFCNAERKALGENKTIIEELEDGNKRSKKIVDEVKNAFADARKKQKDAFFAEAKEWFEQEITDQKDYAVDNMGVRHTAPDFVYSSSFNLGGLIKKAGNNLIIEVGKLQGSPLAIQHEQRKRDIDVYMPFARSFDYDIELDIPEGYTAEGVAALNTKVENETGFFVVEASNTDKKVLIKIRKSYLHRFEAAADFDKILAFVDASGNWVNSRILFKKK